jgi:hypothetical protein
MSDGFAAILRRWYPGRLFLPRENHRSVTTAVAELCVLMGVPALLVGGLLVRSRLRHAARLRAATTMSPAAVVGGAGGKTGAGPGESLR